MQIVKIISVYKLICQTIWKLLHKHKHELCIFRMGISSNGIELNILVQYTYMGFHPALFSSVCIEYVFRRSVWCLRARSLVKFFSYVVLSKYAAYVCILSN